MKVLITFVLCILCLISFSCSISQIYKTLYRPAPCKVSKVLPVSLPEEISEAKKGDRLMVYEVSDSIYIGFSHINKIRKRLRNE